MTAYTGRKENITGANLSGTSGTTNRTYGLAYSNAVIPMFSILKQGAPLHYGEDFTLSANTITFLIEVWDDQIMDLDYLTTSSSLISDNLRYASVLQLVASLSIKKDVPSWDVGSTPTNETVGTGNGTTSIFYLDHRNIISGTYTLYYGTTAAATTTLTETTHYSLDLATGKITLTAVGITLLSTNSIYAAYSYISLDITDEFLESVLLRAESMIDGSLETTFTNGSADNPDYPSITEYMNSQGLWNRNYFVKSRPLLDISSKLTADLTIGGSSLSLTGGDGTKLPASGYVLIGSEIVGYSGSTSGTLTGLTRGALGSTAAAHSSGDEIHTTIVEISSTYQGSDPTWEVLQYNSGFVTDGDTGKIYIYGDTVLEPVVVPNVLMSTQDVANRLRVRYYYGFDSIPTSITRLAILYAQRMLLTDTINKSLIQGRNEFRPEVLDSINFEISVIESSFKMAFMSNT